MKFGRRTRALHQALFFLLASAAFAADHIDTPTGVEFQLNDVPGEVPNVARNAAGDFVVSWYGETTDSSGNQTLNVFVRRFDSSGTPKGPSTQVNTDTYSDLLTGVGIAQDGSFVVVWQAGADNDQGIFGRLYNPDGTPKGGEFQISTGPVGINPLNLGRDYVYQNPTVSMAPNGAFVVAWDENATVKARRYGPDGTALGSDFSVASNGFQFASAAIGSNGQFAVAWDTEDSSLLGLGINPTYGQEIQARCYDSSGNALGAAFDVNPDFNTTSPAHTTPTALIGTNGVLYITYSVTSSDSNNDADIYVRRFDAACNALSNALLINTPSQRALGFPAISADDSGNYIVTWDNMANSIFYSRRYSAQDSPLDDATSVFSTPRYYLNGSGASVQLDQKSYVIVTQDTGTSNLWLRMFGNPSASGTAGTTTGGSTGGSTTGSTTGTTTGGTTTGGTTGSTTGGSTGGTTGSSGDTVTATLTATPTSVTAGGSVAFDASGTTTTNGATISSYTFSFGDGTASKTSTSATLSHTYTAAGNFSAYVVATDSNGYTGASSTVQITSTATVQVSGSSQAVAAMTVTPTSGAAPLTVQFDGSDSFGANGNPISTYTFDFGDGTTSISGSAAKVSHVYTAAGTYSPTLSVTDSAGNTSSSKAMAKVQAIAPSGTGAGTGTGTATGTTTATTATSSGSGGGAFGLITLLPMMLVALRRRRRLL